MPELPEVQTVVSELDRKLKNKKIKVIEVNDSKMVAIGPATLSPKREVSAKGGSASGGKSSKVTKFIELLKGQKILSVRRRAKLLIFDLSGPLSILAHLKMTGQFIYEDKKLRAKTKGLYRLVNSQKAIPVKLPSKHTHVVFNFTDGSILYFNDVRKFGYLKLVRDDELDKVKELAEYGPEPLSKNFTCSAFFTAVKKAEQRKIKEVLMDPKVVAGIGNIYSDEILFHAKVRPTRTVGSLSEYELKYIFKYIPIVLKQAIKAKGSSVGDFIRTDGSWGQMGKYHFVYGRGGEKCKVCGTTIATVKVGGRTSSYCPRCQK